MMPSESHRLHVLSVLFEAAAIARGFILPALVGGISAGGGEFDRIATWTVGLLSIPAILMSVARYFAFRYRLERDELIIDSGLLSRRHRVIPLARIQNIDVQQTALQRVCGVAEVRVETAGSGETEARLRVLSRACAEALRAELLAGRRAAGAAATAAGEPAAGAGMAAGAGAAAHITDSTGEPVLELARLSSRDLLIAGATASEAGLVAAAVAGVLEFLDELVMDPPIPIPDPEAILAHASGGTIMLVVAGTALALLLIGWLLSILGALVGYHGFTLELTASELRKRYGLLTRREGVVPLERVQAVRVEESWIRRPFGLAALKIETAGGGPQERQRGGAEAFVPLARATDVPRLVGAVLRGVDYDALRFRPAHPRAQRRALVRYAAVLGAAGIGLAVVLEPWWLPLLPVLPAAWLMARLYYRNLGHALAPGFVATRAGLFNRITWVVPDRRIQTVHLTSSPFQRRHGLANVVVDTAAGGGLREAAVMDIAQGDALALLDELAGRAAPRRGQDPSRAGGSPAAHLLRGAGGP
ncbi:MAG TPA: PH domain-containing protein [Longimicrobiales bacterium]